MIRFNNFYFIKLFLSCWLDVSPWSYNKRKVSGHFLKFLKLFENLKMINKTKNKKNPNKKNNKKTNKNQQKTSPTLLSDSWARFFWWRLISLWNTTSEHLVMALTLNLLRRILSHQTQRSCLHQILLFCPRMIRNAPTSKSHQTKTYIHCSNM